MDSLKLATTAASTTGFCRIKVLYVAKGAHRLAYTKMLDSVTERFQKKGVHLMFTMVNNGLSALEFSKVAHYDVVFIDENIEIISPIELASSLRILGYLIPVIRITSHPDQSESKAHEKLFSRTIVKPFDRRDLMKILLNSIQFSSEKNEITKDDKRCDVPVFPDSSETFSNRGSTPLESSYTSCESNSSGDSSGYSSPFDLSPKPFKIDDFEMDFEMDFDSFFDGDLSDTAFI